MRITSADEAVEQAAAAVATAVGERRVVLLNLPLDVQTQNVDAVPRAQPPTGPPPVPVDEAELEQLARSKALKGDVRSVQAACRLGGAKRVKVETVERLCRKVLGTNPHELYGEGFDKAWQYRGKRVNERVQAFDHCFSSPKSVSLLAADEPLPTAEDLGRQFEQFLAGLDRPDNDSGQA